MYTGLLTNKWFRRSIAALAVIVILIFMLVSMYRFAHRQQPLKYGVSFSAAQAESLGLDWRQTYQAILEELEIKKLRLVNYWNQTEPQPGMYNFAELDEQFALANQYGAKVSLAIGLRQPRWPECHQPAWAANLENEQWQQALNSYITTVVERYRGNPALESWQLENEYYNRDFGHQCRDYNQQRVQQEFDLVKQLDPSHPIIMSQSDQFGLPLSSPHPDEYGFSIYKRVFDARILKRYITHPIPAWYHSLRAMLVENIWHRPVIVHELQAEPWATQPINQISEAERDKTMSLTQLQRNLDFARNTGIKQQYLWGAEWWYWQKQQGNPEYWDTIKDLLN